MPSSLPQTLLRDCDRGCACNAAVRDFEQAIFVWAIRVQQESNKSLTRVQQVSIFNKTHMLGSDALISFMVDMMDFIFNAKGKYLGRGLLAWVPEHVRVFMARDHNV